MNTLNESNIGTLSTVDLATLGYLTRYTGPTRENYEVSLKLFFAWCKNNQLDVLKDVTRPLIELFGRYLENERKNMPSTVAHHLIIVKGFYKFAYIDEYIVKSPAEHIKIPRVFKDESTTVGLGRNDMGKLLTYAKQSSQTELALITLMSMLGLRVSEAINVRIEDFSGTDQGHRILRIMGKGKKPATIPLPIPVLRSLEDACGDRTEGLLLLRSGNRAYTRKAATLCLARLCKKAGITLHITPHSLRHSFITACLDAGASIRDVQIAARHADPKMTMRYDRGRHNLDRHANHTLSAFLSGSL